MTIAATYVLRSGTRHVLIGRTGDIAGDATAGNIVWTFPIPRKYRPLKLFASLLSDDVAARIWQISFKAAAAAGVPLNYRVGLSGEHACPSGRLPDARKSQIELPPLTNEDVGDLINIEITTTNTNLITYNANLVIIGTYGDAQD